MTLTATTYVCARLSDYWGRRKPWQRRLWNLGTVAMLEEVLEAAAMQRDGHFQERPVTTLAAAATKQLGRDPGIGPAPVRRELQRALADLHGDSASVRRLQLLLAERAPSYLDEWRRAWSEPASSPECEFTSRSLGAHLLDCGFSPDHLHRWLTAVTSGSGSMSVADLIDEACQLSARPLHPYEVLIPVKSLPRHRQQMPSSWLEPSDVARWIRERGPGEGARIRQNGGFLFSVEARDPWRAVEIASDIMQSLAARVVVGLPGQNELVVQDVAVVRGSPRTFPLRRPRRQVEVHALSRQGVLFDATHSALGGRLRFALDLLAPLESCSPESAVAGGWAAAEAILNRRDAANVQAADELGALVACSLPRAELTTLAYAYIENHDDPLAQRLTTCSSNRERCNLLAQAIADRRCADFPDPSDAAAAARVAAILSSPREVLGRVREYSSEAFRRLYRQRNLVLHAGMSNSVAMLATLRCAPPLLGAAFDRIVHAALKDPPIDPGALIARAQVSLQLVGSVSGRSLGDLLD